MSTKAEVLLMQLLSQMISFTQICEILFIDLLSKTYCFSCLFAQLKQVRL